MEFRHLKYFIAVAETLHFAKAADRLGISGPTLTVQIQELERELHARLLNRVRRTVSLTPAGESFLREARVAVEQLERAKATGQRAGRGEIGRIEVGYIGSAAYAGVLQEQIRRYRAAWPNVALSAREYPMDDLPALVQEGTIDIGFIRLPVQLNASLGSHVLLHDEFCAALPEDHVLAATRGPLMAKALAGEAFILPEQPMGTYEVARRGRFTPHISMSPGSLVAVLTQVSVGAGVSILPSAVRGAVTMHGVVYRSLAGKTIPSAVAAIFRKQEHSATAARFVEMIRRTRPVTH